MQMPILRWTSIFSHSYDVTELLSEVKQVIWREFRTRTCDIPWAAVQGSL